MVEEIRKIFEKRGFEVCTRLGDRLNMRASNIRLFFIYTSFMTLGSPLIVYFSLAFVIKLKDYLNSKRTSVFDL